MCTPLCLLFIHPSSRIRDFSAFFLLQFFCLTYTEIWIYFRFLQEMHLELSFCSLSQYPLIERCRKKWEGTIVSLLFCTFLDWLFFPFSSDLTSQRKRGWIHNCLQLTCFGEILWFFLVYSKPKQFEFNFTPVTSYENIDKCTCTSYRYFRIFEPDICMKLCSLHDRTHLCETRPPPRWTNDLFFCSFSFLLILLPNTDGREASDNTCLEKLCCCYTFLFFPLQKKAGLFLRPSFMGKLLQNTRT